MRNVTLALLSLSLFVGLTVSAQAKGPEKVSTTIPFAFVVSGAKLPAGEYVVRRNSQTDPSALVIQSKDGRHAAYFIADIGEAAEPMLVFDEVDGEHYLRQVGTSLGLRTIPQSSAEVQAIRIAKKSGNSSSAAGQ